jgi:three-Cys-motif partner protein
VVDLDGCATPRGVRDVRLRLGIDDARYRSTSDQSRGSRRIDFVTELAFIPELAAHIVEPSGPVSSVNPHMGKAEYREVSDGFTARVAPVWTEEKLRVLDCYLAGFAKACQSHPLGWYALDIFAGGGLNVSDTSGTEIKGSALIALETTSPLAQRVILCENSSKVIPALTARVAPYGDRARVFCGNSNEKIEELLALVPHTAPTFAFLDPEGSELDWATVKAIADHKRNRSANKIEQLILFPTDTGFVRMLPVGREPNPEWELRVTTMFGHDRWREIYERRKRDLITPDDARTAYVQLYCQGLRDLGYEFVQERQISDINKKNVTGASRYFLIHATDKPAGDSIMSWCFDKRHVRPDEEQHGQASMFTVPVAPRKRRLSTVPDED